MTTDPAQPSNKEKQAASTTGGGNCIYNALIGAFVEPDDDFVQRLRKGTLGFFFCCVPLTIIFTTEHVIMNQDFASRPAIIISMTMLLVLGCIMTISYLIARNRRHVSDNLITSFGFGQLIAIALAVFFVDVEWDSKSMLFVGVFAMIMVQVRFLPLYLAMAFLLQLVNDWNSAQLGLDNAFFIAFPGYKVGSTLLLRFTGEIIGTGLLFIGAYLFHLQVDQSKKQAAAQAAANEMTMRVLNVQKNYDCDKIDTILDGCESEGVVNEDMIQLFRGMNANLKSYKPFLPNYLFQTSAAEDFDGRGEEDEEEHEGQTNNLLEGDEEGELKSADGSSAADKKLSRHSSRKNSMSMTKGARYQHGRRLSQSGNRRGDLDTTSEISDSKSVASSHHHHRKQQQSNNALSKTLHRGALFTGRVTLALVDLNFGRILTTSPTASSSTAIGDENTDDYYRQHLHADIYSVVVNEIYRAASAAKASVHSLLGDTAQLSWNATHPIPLGETKGALFLTRLSKVFDKVMNDGNAAAGAGDKEELEIPESSSSPASWRKEGSIVGIRAIGAIATGKASVHSILTVSTKQQALVVEANWLPVLEAQLELAKKYRCVVMDESSEKTASFEVEAVPVEIISQGDSSAASTKAPTDFLYHQELSSGRGKTTTSVSSEAEEGKKKKKKSSTVFRILGEKSRKDDEWMYQLQHDAAREEGVGEKDGTQTREEEKKMSSVDLMNRVLGLLAEGQYGAARSEIAKVEDRQSSGANSSTSMINPFLAQIAEFCDEKITKPAT